MSRQFNKKMRNVRLTTTEADAIIRAITFYASELERQRGDALPYSHTLMRALDKIEGARHG